MDIPGWIATTLLAISVFCLALPQAAAIPPRSSRGWVLAGFVLAIVSGVLFVIPALDT